MTEGRDSEAERARDADRLKDLEARLGAKQRKGETVAQGTSDFSQANLAWRMVIELVAGLVIGFAIGFGLDRLFGTMPVMLVIFVLLGLAAGVRTMMRTAAEVNKKPALPGDDKGE